jgi:hypothetical protein
MNNLIDDVKEALKDIIYEFDDYMAQDEYDRRHDPGKYIGSRSTPGSNAWMKILVPHMLGMFVGCAFARLFCLPPLGYIIMAVLFAFLTGTVKSNCIDNISMKYALIRNAVILFVFILIIGILALIVFLMHI